MRWVRNHGFDGGGFVIKLLGGDTSVIVVKELEDGQDEWCNFSCDRVAKSGKILIVDGPDDMFDEGSLKK